MIEMAVLVLLPFLGSLLCFVLPRLGNWIGLAVAIGQLPAALSLALQVHREGPLRMAVGGWEVPLGIGLYADGLSALLLCLSAIVGLGASLHAMGYFDDDPGHDTNSHGAGWWPLWLLLWAGLNGSFLAADAFNVYVTLELIGLSGVALVALEKHAAAAAIRYLLVGLLGSMFYLLGVGLLYARYASVDIDGLADVVTKEPATLAAMALMSAGLLLKAALFPLHFWLPPAHANAPAPVSAVLSALVVKAAFYALLRLWYGPFDPLDSTVFGQLLGLLGTGAILWGSLQALFAPRLKLVVAYSTVAQIGYLFLLFPLADTPDAAALAWYGGIWLALSHGLAKAGLFLAAGNIQRAAGHDRVTDLAGAGQRLPITLFAVGLACASLMGLPPSGGFVGKWLLLNAAFVSGQWWWVLVFLTGGVLAAAYSFRILLHAFRNRENDVPLHTLHPVMQWSALGLALGAIFLGVWSATPLSLLEVGSVVGSLTLTEAAP